MAVTAATKCDQTVLLKQGAEAKIYSGTFMGCPAIIKERFSKAYRHPELDKSLTVQRTKAEVRSIMRCRMIGICTPTVYFVDMERHRIFMEHVPASVTVREYIADVERSRAAEHVQALGPLAEKIGATVGLMHSHDVIHGDLTTSNMLLSRLPKGGPDAGGDALDGYRLVLIDFGLGYKEGLAEDKGVDLYVLERAFLSTHPNTEALFSVILEHYKLGYGKGAADVISKLEEVRMRGRKRTMVG